ncbi:hypothetical protein SARC_17933, partial [Sphaeroforma arctica JP610]
MSWFTPRTHTIHTSRHNRHLPLTLQRVTNLLSNTSHSSHSAVINTQLTANLNRISISFLTVAQSPHTHPISIPPPAQAKEYHAACLALSRLNQGYSQSSHKRGGARTVTAVTAATSGLLVQSSQWQSESALMLEREMQKFADLYLAPIQSLIA